MATEAEIKEYLESAIKGFVDDPPDSEFLTGYRAALDTIYADLFMTREQRSLARKPAYGEVQ